MCVMGRLDRTLIAAILDGHLKFDDSATFSPRFANIGKLRLVRAVHGRWELIVGSEIHHVKLGWLTHNCIEVCRRYHKPPQPPQETP